MGYTCVVLHSVVMMMVMMHSAPSDDKTQKRWEHWQPRVRLRTYKFYLSKSTRNTGGNFDFLFISYYVASSSVRQVFFFWRSISELLEFIWLTCRLSG